jgi:Uma2 family endonuclease
VPDVAFLSYERLGYDEDEAAQIPYMAPDAAIEILSPDDGRADIEEKIRVYLASGTALVLVIDPQSRAFNAYAAGRAFAADAVFEHHALAKFSIAVASVFEKTKPPQR